MRGINPLTRDTDADGLNDGVELGKPGVPFPFCQSQPPGDDDPQTTTNSNDPDSDDDGFCDGPATVPMVCVAGEDENANGRVDGGETNPNVNGG